MKKITTIILAAGKSTRFKSSKSKIFHEISDRPMIEYILEKAKKVSNKIIIVCNKNNIGQIKKNYNFCETVIQKNQNGTASAINITKSLVSKNTDVLVLFGDVPLIEQMTINKLIKNYKSNNNKGTILAFKAKNPLGYGRLEAYGKYIKKVTEEFQAKNEIKKINLCNSGIMICNSNYLFSKINQISDKNYKKEKFLTDLFEIAYKDNKSFNYILCSENELQGINTRNQLLIADEFMQNKIKSKLIKNGTTLLQPNTIRVSFDTFVGRDSILEPHVIIKKGVKIGKNVIIKSHSVVESCNVGDNSSIGPSARIRPFSKIGKSVKIGNFVEIKNSKIGDNSSISHLSYVGDSFVGKKVNIGAGTITCNYDGKNKNITKIKDNVFVGSNSSLIAPLTINKNATIGAGSVITRNIAKNSLAIERSSLKILIKRSKTNKN